MEQNNKPRYAIERELANIEKLREHEEINPIHLEELKEKIASDKILKFAITVDKNTNIILDGEHRFNALKELECQRIPVIYVDYNSPDILVQTWRNGNITKKDVIEAGLSGRKLPPTTSKHMIKIGNRLRHISTIEKQVNLPLDQLKIKISLIEIKSLKPSMNVDLKEALPFFAKFLSTNTVDEPVIVDEKTSVVLKGHESFQALDLLSAAKVPVLKVDAKAVKLRTLQKSRDSLTGEDIIDSGLRGPKLPPGSFEVLLEPVKISVKLEELLGPQETDRRVLRVYNSTLELLYRGWPTPLVRLNSLSTNERNVWAKLEAYNPFSNSVKDRIGFSMIMEALEQGILKKVLYEATSTNTGIALTSIANTIGIKTKLYVPQTIQKVSDTYLKILGAEVERLPISLTIQAVSQVDSEAKTHKAAHLNQFENDANLKAHLKYTAKELDEQLRSVGVKPSCIIGGLGTSGHMSAISCYFKGRYKDNVTMIGVQPSRNEVIPGIRRIETGMKWCHWTQFDEIVDVTQTEAIEGALSIARQEGLLIGLSAGAVVHAFKRSAKNHGTYILVLPDSGYKYAEQFESYFESFDKQKKG